MKKAEKTTLEQRRRAMEQIQQSNQQARPTGFSSVCKDLNTFISVLPLVDGLHRDAAGLPPSQQQQVKFLRGQRRRVEHRLQKQLSKRFKVT